MLSYLGPHREPTRVLPITILVCTMLMNTTLIKFGLFEKHTKFEKKSSSWFGRLLSKCRKHEEDYPNFCLLLRKSEL